MELAVAGGSTEKTIPASRLPALRCESVAQAYSGEMKISPRSTRRWPFLVAAMLAEPIAMKLRGYRIGGNLVVRCRKGHLFTTLWLPGASLKSLRFAWWRFQRCPVGKHWSIITPVKDSDLTRDEKRIASERRDVRIR
jgi:hypothetical protein